METGLENKPPYYGLIIGLAIGLALWGLYHFQLSDGVRREIDSTQQKIDQLQVKIQEGKAAKQQLPQFTDQVRRLELELDKLLKILPARRNTQELIRRIRVLTEQAGFDMLNFDPAESEVDREIYKEWPIRINIRGGYHELALFFDRVSRMRRIINIENLQLTANTNQDRHTLNARFTAKTFVYKETEPAEDEGGEGRKAR